MLLNVSLGYAQFAHSDTQIQGKENSHKTPYGELNSTIFMHLYEKKNCIWTVDEYADN